jgi:hypothetical protein
VLVIELENALANMQSNAHSTVLWSPYREPLTKFLNKYSVEVSKLCSPSVAGLVTRVGAVRSKEATHFVHQDLGRVFVKQPFLYGGPEE